ncbi:MAG: GNAT family N-acetyltransferase [Spirochaetaceae bacterium]|jgi:hypothetical protein|nr:GNAT family N-acetyltransferase [Spirochaetaceae bacterium]
MWINARNVSINDLHVLFQLNDLLDAEELADVYIDNEESCFGVYHNKKCVGYLLAQKNSDSCHIRHFFVAEIKEKMKTSQFLHKAFEDYVDKNKIQNISIDMKSTDRDIINFFLSKGYIKEEPEVFLRKEWRGL